MHELATVKTMDLSVDPLQLVESHVVEISADLMQIRLLLDEAITKLDHSFNGVYAAIEQQRSDVGGETNKTVKLHLHQAITGLQFHDLTSQLLDRATRRLDGLCDIIDYSHNMASDEGEANNLQQLSNNLHNTFSQSLRQQHMDSGDVELF